MTADAFFAALNIYADMPRATRTQLERDVDDVCAELQARSERPREHREGPSAFRVIWSEECAALLYVVWLLRGKVLVRPSQLKVSLSGRVELIPEILH